MATFIVISVQGTGGSPTGPDPEYRVGVISPGRSVSSGLQVPGEPGHVVQEQDSLGEITAASNVPAEMSNTPR